MPARGSSPLTRGKPADGAPRGLRPGLIPAHAGKTTGRCRYRRRPWAHPRSRGENPHVPEPLPQGEGSSPLTRGKPAYRTAPSMTWGLIPAHAGKTHASNSTGVGLGAHPRSRGENRRLRRGAVAYEGSSPLTRGKQRRRCRVVPGDRLIPAHAGKTTPYPARPRPGRAHPRSRGENRDGHDVAARPEGSSPLTRGKHDQAAHRNPCDRLIPAHAGKTGLSDAW